MILPKLIVTIHVNEQVESTSQPSALSGLRRKRTGEIVLDCVD